MQATTSHTTQSSAAVDRPHDTPAFSGSVWFQEKYFLAVLQQEIERTHEAGQSLAIVLVRVPEYTRRAARELFIYAEAARADYFYGLLSNGDCVVCMPGSAYAEAAAERSKLSHALYAFGATSGLAVLDQEVTATELLAIAEPAPRFSVQDGDDAEDAASAIHPHCFSLLRHER